MKKHEMRNWENVFRILYSTDKVYYVGMGHLESRNPSKFQIFRVIERI